MATAAKTGDIVTAYCKVCKKLLEHVIVEIKAKGSKRVQCKTCDDTHPFRASIPAPRKKTAGSRARGAAAGESYESLMTGRDPILATEYAMNVQFSDNELLEHKTFGLGVVTRVLFNRKIEVMFEDSAKTLAHDRS